MIDRLTTLLTGLTLLLAVTGCDNPSNAAPEQARASAANDSQAAAASPAASKVTRIVFVGKENACECTRRAIDAGWATLQQALGTPAALPVEQLQSDTEDSKVEPYRKQKPMMALPGIYFVDDKGAVLELLQGEITESQVTTALKR